MGFPVRKRRTRRGGRARSGRVRRQPATGPPGLRVARSGRAPIRAASPDAHPSSRCAMRRPCLQRCAGRSSAPTGISCGCAQPAAAVARVSNFGLPCVRSSKSSFGRDSVSPGRVHACAYFSGGACPIFICCCPPLLMLACRANSTGGFLMAASVSRVGPTAGPTRSYRGRCVLLAMNLFRRWR